MDVRGSNSALVIGARGVLGALTVDAFADAGWSVRSAVKRPSAGQVRIDLAHPGSVAEALREYELVINTVPQPGLLAERYVLERGGVLVNTSALPASAGRSLRAVAGCARGTVLMNAGLAPGVTTVAAADLLRRHPDATDLEIVFTLSLSVPRGPASLDFIHRGLTSVARHPTVVVPLPSPFGERRCLGFGEGEGGWLGGIAEGRVVRQYICVAESAIHQRLLDLNAAGEMRTLPRSLIGARARADRTTSHEPVAHWIAAIHSGRRLGARTVECRGDFLHAARSTVVFASALRTVRRNGGCFDPEEICALADVEAELSAVGISVVPRRCGVIED